MGEETGDFWTEFFIRGKNRIFRRSWREGRWEQG
jgi:hypothetical protein